MTENRYALFAWDDYDAAGGVLDFERFGTMDELRAEAERLLLSGERDAAQIADAETLREVCWARRHYNRAEHPDSIQWYEADAGQRGDE